MFPTSVPSVMMERLSAVTGRGMCGGGGRMLELVVE